MKATFTHVLLALFFCIGVLSTQAQLTVTANNNATQLAQQLAGPGVSISNATLTGIPNSAGTFTSAAGCNLNMPSGIILSTGVATRSVGPNNFPAVGPVLGESIGPGDADIDAITASFSLDACVLTFDVTVLSDSLQFSYVFGSDEYMEYVGSYNDAFAFIISGPGITTQNLAVLPGSGTQVTINNVNAFTNSAYYVNNTPGACLEYDGFTTVLTAQIGGLTPCATYNIKLVVADIIDQLVDSGVFLLSNSFTSNLPSIDSLSLSASNTTNASEGCVNGTVTFSIPNARPTPTVVSYTITGTAINGTDYTAIGNSVTIPANATSATLAIQPTLDGLAEGTETVKLYLTNTCSAIPYDSITLNIVDRPAFTTSNDTSVCLGAIVQMSASAGATNYSWTPALEFTTATNIQSPSVAPTVTRTYTASSTLGTCTFTDTVRISIIPTPFTIDAGPDIFNCTGGTTLLTATPVGSALPGNPFVYLWSPAGTLSNANISNPTVNAGLSGTYVIRLSSAQCFDTDTVQVIQGSLAATYSERDISCFNLANGSAAVTSVVGVNPITYTWSNGASNVTSISGLVPNTYTVTVSDGVGCTTSHNFVITQPAQLSTNIVGVFPLGCSGTGSATVVPSGGTTPYTYLWSHGPTTATVNSLPAGNTYTVTVTDDSLCTATNSFNIPSINPPTTSGVATDVVCRGSATGAIDLTVTGTSGPYGFAWSHGPATEDVSGLLAGTYYITVTDINTCAVIDTFVVTEPTTALTVNTNLIQNVQCFGGNNGAAYAIGNGGTGSISYAWSNGVNNDTVTNLSAGTVYTVTVTDANLCTATAAISVTQPALLNAGVAVVQNVSCFAGNNGVAFSTGTGGTTPYNYSWSNVVNNDTTTGLSAGTVYTVTITDANLCTATNTISVTEPLQLTVNTNLIQNVGCFGGNNGSVYAVANNGTAPYNYAWSNAVNNDTVNNLVQGIHTVTVTDANSCTASAIINITQPLALTVSTSVIQNVSCFGGNNGSALAVANDGTTPYNFTWSNGVNNDTTINLSQGTVYTVTVTDANNCTAVNTISVTQSLALSLSVSLVNNVSCFGGNNGSALAVAGNGTSPYNFTWSNGVNNDTVTGLSAGTSYTVTATDANNCTASNTISVTEPAQFDVFISAIQNVLCNGQNNGSAFALGNGGVFPYSYAWSNGINDDTTTGLAPLIIYTVTATDANGCTATDNVSVIEPAVLTVSVVGTNISCFGGSNGTATATANGGTNPYTYNWNGFTGNPYNSLVAGTYPVTVVDDNGCTATDSVTLTQPTRIEFDSVVVTNLSCFGGSDGTITVYNSGGTGVYGYLWNNGVAPVSNPTGLAQGFYSVTVNDANNCTRDTAVTISQPTPVLVSASVLNNISCNGANDGSAFATGSGGTGPYTFSWSSGAIIDTTYNLAPGNVDVTVTDANSCTATNNTFITEPNILTTANVLGINYCATPAYGDDTLTAFGGTAPYTYSVSAAGTNTTGIFNNLLANNYTYTVTDDNGCTDTGSFVMPVVAADTYTQNNTNISCFGGNDGVIDVTADVAANGPYQFSLDNGTFQGTGVFSTLTATTHQVVAQNWFGCFDTLSITLTQPATAVSVSIVTTDVICNGDANGTALATGNGGTPGYSFVWSNGSVVDSAVALPAGNITCTVTDANGCTASNSATVSEPPALTLNVTGTDVLCNGEATGTISAIGGGGIPAYGYSASLDGVNFINSPAGQFSGLFAGNYTVYINDNNSCLLTVPFVINEPPVLNLQLSTVDATCFGFNDGEITAVGGGGVGGFTYTIETGESNTSGVFNNLSTDMYTVTLTDQNNCDYNDSIEVSQPDSMIVEVIPNIDTIVMGETLEINAQSNYSGVTYLWFPANALTCDNCDNPTFLGYNNQTIQVQGTDANGCAASNSVEIIVVPYYDVFTPNSFTPNADGSNDFWNTFIPKAAAVKGLEVQVFNRIGEKVFESFEVDFKWDGTYKGQPVPPGVYVYTMKMEWLNGHVSKIYKGAITLLR